MTGLNTISIQEYEQTMKDFEKNKNSFKIILQNAE